jgi:acylphosphatase
MDNNRSTTSDVTLRATVRGRVQGVFFRAFIGQAAERLHIGGYVCNQPDGSVYVAARGDRRKLEELLGILRQGPEMARVETVEHTWAEGDTGISPGRFEVRR